MDQYSILKKSEVETETEIDSDLEMIHPSLFESTFDGSKAVNDGKYLITTYGSNLIFTDTSTGKVINRLESESDEIMTFVINKHTDHLNTMVYATRSLMLHHINYITGEVLKSWHAHSSVVLDLSIDPTGSLLASGSSDGTIHVYDIVNHFITHLFKSHTGIVSRVSFSPDSTLIVSAGDDNRVRLWNLIKSTKSKKNMPKNSKSRSKKKNQKKSSTNIPPLLKLITDHTSPAADFEWTVFDSRLYLFTAGRDTVVRCFEISSENSPESPPKFIKNCGTLFTNMELSSISIFQTPTPTKSKSKTKNTQSPPLEPDSKYLLTAGLSGVISIWKADSIFNPDFKQHHLPKPVWSHQFRPIEDYCQYLPGDKLLFVCQTDIFILDIFTGEITDVTVGHLESILSSSLLGNFSRDPLAIATSSDFLYILSHTPKTSFALGEGHSGPILSVASASAQPNQWTIMTGSGDQDCRIWQYNSSTGRLNPDSIQLSGHTERVTSVALASCFSTATATSQVPFAASVSSDKTIKIWNLATNQCTFTRVASLKGDLTCVTISPNNQFIAVGSQDKYIRIFRIHPDTLELDDSYLTLKGHKRTVWDIQFARTATILVSGSADKTIRVWNCMNGDLIKVIEGPLSAVTQVGFLNYDTHILSAESSGLIHIWSLSSMEKLSTFDLHQGRVNSISVLPDDVFEAKKSGAKSNSATSLPQEEEEEEDPQNPHPDTDPTAITQSDEKFISCGSDSKIFVGIDTGRIQREKENLLNSQKLLKTQDFENALRQGEFQKAWSLALDLDMGSSLKKISKQLLDQGNPELLSELIKKTNDPLLKRLVSHLKLWNRTTRTSPLAQQLLNIVVYAFPPKKMANLLGTDTVDILLKGSTRHFDRMDRLLSQTFVLDQTLFDLNFTGALDEALDDDIN